MIYGLIFLRSVITPSQKQSEAIQQYADKHHFHIDKFISYENTPDAATFKSGDSVIFFSWDCISSERANLNTFIRYSLQNNICIYSATSTYCIDKSKDFKQFLYAFNLYEEIRFSFLSGKSKGGLQKQIANGKKLGRVKGSKNSTYAWNGKEKKILALYAQGVSMYAISKKVKLSAPTIKRFLATHN